MILECYAVPSDLPAIGDVRSDGILVASVSISSAAVNVMLPPLATGPLAILDLAVPGPTGVLIPSYEIDNLPAWLASADIDPDIANAIEDAVEEVGARQTALWIGFA